MAEKFRTEKGGKVLQFAQDGEFYYRSGSSKLEKNDLTGAIASYRMALKLDPKNYDAVLGIAEILTAMGRTEESNRLLMVKFREEERPAEAYFGMGCNFFAQREYDQARMSFDKYLDEDPEGEFAYTAYDMAEAIDDGTAQAYQEGPFAVPGYTEAEQARRLMEKEDFKGAIELLEKLWKSILSFHMHATASPCAIIAYTITTRQRIRWVRCLRKNPRTYRHTAIWLYS